MIELCDGCEYSVLIADLIATLSVYDKDNIPFKVMIWITGSELPHTFTSSDYFNFLQEGIRVERNNRIVYLFYDVFNQVEVVKNVFI